MLYYHAICYLSFHLASKFITEIYKKSSTSDSDWNRKYHVQNRMGIGTEFKQGILGMWILNYSMQFFARLTVCKVNLTKSDNNQAHTC